MYKLKEIIKLSDQHHLGLIFKDWSIMSSEESTWTDQVKIFRKKNRKHSQNWQMLKIAWLLLRLLLRFWNTLPWKDMDLSPGFFLLRLSGLKSSTEGWIKKQILAWGKFRRFTKKALNEDSSQPASFSTFYISLRIHALRWGHNSDSWVYGIRNLYGIRIRTKIPNLSITVTHARQKPDMLDRVNISLIYPIIIFAFDLNSGSAFIQPYNILILDHYWESVTLHICQQRLVVFYTVTPISFMGFQLISKELCIAQDMFLTDRINLCNLEIYLWL